MSGKEALLKPKYIPAPPTPAIPVPELHPVTNLEGKDFKNPKKNKIYNCKYFIIT